MEAELNFQKICPKCGRLYKAKFDYCRDCGSPLEEREPIGTQTSTAQVSETTIMQTPPSTVIAESRLVKCKNCGVSLSVESWRITCPNCGKNLHKRQKTQNRLSDATKGFLIVFSFFMVTSTLIYYYRLKLPINQTLLASLIISFIFGDLTRNIINYPNKSDTHKRMSICFWGCFLFFGVPLSLGLSFVFGAYWGLIAGMGIGFGIGLAGGFLGIFDIG